MTQWSPKPLRPATQDAIFAMSEEYTVEKSYRTPIQRQRDLDGTPFTKGNYTGLGPSVNLYLGEDRLSKGSASDEPKKQIDPDAIMKAYLSGNG
jgi:hypothetical protein